MKGRLNRDGDLVSFRRPRGIVGYAEADDMGRVRRARRRFNRMIIRRHREAKARERGGTYRPTKSSKRKDR